MNAVIGPRPLNALRWKLFGLQLRWHKQINQRFDDRYGTDTAGETALVQAGVPADAAVAGNQIYRPLWEGLFHRIIRSFAPLGLERYHFVDLGSGKGKLLLLASRYAFRRITGVEYSPVLHAAAQRNIEIFSAAVQSDRPVESLHQDATTFEPVAGPCIALVFNSFSDDIMARVMARLGQAAGDRSDPLFLVYVNVRNVRECPVALSGAPELAPIVRRRNYIIMANRAGAAAWSRMAR